MQIAIISSTKDPAGVNIRHNLLENYDFKRCGDFDWHEVLELTVENKSVKSYLIESELVYSEDPDKKIHADLFIFASKHRSKENTPSFAVHSIGNWNDAKLGGKEKTLVSTNPAFIKNFFKNLNNSPREGYEITMEATHHGPFLAKPSVFVEVGSTEAEWNDKRNGKIIADCIIRSLSNEAGNPIIAFGIGGPHYCNTFNKLSLNTDIAFSFICPKYALEYLDEDMIKQAAQKSVKLDFAVLDWKGMGQEKQRIIGLLDKLKIPYLRSDKI
jgi:D-aminoacyl-tRNA deacylase